MPSTGTIPFPMSNDRAATATAVAGVLAEHGIQRIVLADPRVCATQTLAARETDLPRIIVEAHPGTTLSCGEVGVLIDSECIKWAGDGPLAAALMQMAIRAKSPEAG